MTRVRLRNTAILLAGILLFLWMTLRGALVAKGAARGLALCRSALIPSLFPFLVLCDLLIRLRAEGGFSPFSRTVSGLFGISRAAATALLSGFLCGFPNGTTAGIFLYEQGEISKKELQRISLFANMPSGAFIIATVGRGLFGQSAVGVVLFLITLFSACCIGLSLRFFKDPAAKATKPTPHLSLAGPFSEHFTKSIRAATVTLAGICACLVFFSAVQELICALPFVAGLPATLRVLLLGSLEMTSGIFLATALPAETAFVTIAFLLGFSGISIFVQFLALCENVKLRFLPAFCAKLLHGILNALFAKLFLLLFSPTLLVTRPTFNNLFAPRHRLFTAFVPCALCLGILSVGAAFSYLFLSRRSRKALQKKQKEKEMS